MKNGSHRYDINRPRARPGQEQTYIKNRLEVLSKHFSNTWSPFHEKIKNAEPELKKSVAYKTSVHFKLVLNHKVDNGLYDHQWLPVLINISRKFCYWHRQSWKLYLRKIFQFFLQNFSQKELLWKVQKNFLKIPWEATFLKLHVSRQWISENCTSLQMFPEIFRRFSEQRFGSPIKGKPCFLRDEPQKNRSQWNIAEVS